MKTLAASLVLVTVLGGCTAQTKRAGLVGGGVITALGSMLAVSGGISSCSSYDAYGCDSDSGLSAGMGVITATAGIIMLLAAAGAPDDDESRVVAVYPEGPVEPNWVPMVAVAPAPPTSITVTTNVTVTTGDGTIDPQTIELVHTLPVPAPRTSDPMLRQFTQQASMAARAGQCLAVRAIAVRVEDLDAGYRHDGFLRDPLVVACLN